MSERPAPAPTLRAEIVELSKLGGPIALTQLAMMAMGLVDVAVLGNSSVTDLAGTGLARALLFATLTISIGAANALDALASQALGAGEPGRAYAAYRGALRDRKSVV